MERIEGLMTQQERLAEAEGLQELAEIARAKILDAIDRHKRGEPIPEPSVRHDGPHHEALRRWLHETRERLERFGYIRERMP